MSPRSPAAQTIETHHLHWDGIRIEITHATDWLDSGVDHLEITSILRGRCAPKLATVRIMSVKG